MSNYMHSYAILHTVDPLFETWKLIGMICKLEIRQTTRICTICRPSLYAIYAITTFMMVSMHYPLRAHFADEADLKLRANILG